MMQKIQVLTLILIVIFGCLALYSNSKDTTISEIFTPGTPVVHIGEIPLRVEIADTDALRMQGLSGRKELTSVNGMLFVFDEPDFHGIWMKDMNFPIDIIWISEDLEVVGIDKGVHPNTYPRTFRPPVPAKYVVETNERYTETFGLNVGNKVRLPVEVARDQ